MQVEARDDVQGRLEPEAEVDPVGAVDVETEALEVGQELPGLDRSRAGHGEALVAARLDAARELVGVVEDVARVQPYEQGQG